MTMDLLFCPLHQAIQHHKIEESLSHYEFMSFKFFQNRNYLDLEVT